MRSDRPAAVHAERTADPAIVRWVVRGDALHAVTAGTRRPPRTTPLGALLHDATVTSVLVGPGEVRIAADPATWPSIVASVDAALRRELEADAPWLTDAPVVEDATPTAPLDVFQVALDADGAALAASHGGAIRVVAVDASAITVALLGACGHCALSSETLQRIVLPAARRVDPRITTVALARSDRDDDAGGLRRLTFRRRRAATPAV